MLALLAAVAQYNSLLRHHVLLLTNTTSRPHNTMTEVCCDRLELAIDALH